MKAIKLSAFLFMAAMQLSAMEVMQGTEVEEPISPEFNYFDREAFIIAGVWFYSWTSVRHLPTMRTYTAYDDDKGIHGHYREKDQNEVNKLSTSKAEAVFSTVTQIYPDTSAQKKKALFDQLHATLTQSTKSKLLEQHASQEKDN